MAISMVISQWRSLVGDLNGDLSMAISMVVSTAVSMLIYLIAGDLHDGDLLWLTVSVTATKALASAILEQFRESLCYHRYF